MKSLTLVLLMASVLSLCLSCVTSTYLHRQRRSEQRNVFDADLEACSFDPRTGWFRDGYCRTDRFDYGIHTVCAVMTDEFLEYTSSQGNDLSTPRGSFPGLKAGDRWCLCAQRWAQAQRAGKAPNVDLSATMIKTLRYVDRSVLDQYSVSSSQV